MSRFIEINDNGSVEPTCINLDFIISATRAMRYTKVGEDVSAVSLKMVDGSRHIVPMSDDEFLTKYLGYGKFKPLLRPVQ